MLGIFQKTEKKDENKTMKDAMDDIIQRLHLRMQDVEGRVLSLETENKVFRDKVLRKIQKKNNSNQVADEEDQQIKLKTGESIMRYHNVGGV